MNDTALPRGESRRINVNSAIDRSSFQLPVLVAITSKSADDKVVQIFATAHDVFVHIFSFRIDRLRERLSANKVEKLVPASARLRDSLDDEYVLIVRARAIFWFSGQASRRVEARRLLLEHAHELAKAEWAPSYRLRTRAAVIRAAVTLLGVAAFAAVALLAGQLSTRWASSLDGAATQTFSFDVATKGGAGDVARGAKPAASTLDACKPVADFIVPAGGWADASGDAAKDSDGACRVLP
jgi:hypothetical protein